MLEFLCHSPQQILGGEIANLAGEIPRLLKDSPGLELLFSSLRRAELSLIVLTSAERVFEWSNVSSNPRRATHSGGSLVYRF
jgi:hypothetical protein